MAAEGFPDHAISVTLASGLTYSSVFFPKPPGTDKATILFLHGFPSSSYDWHNQISYFSSKGYGVIAPDLLGYGGTSSPKSLEPYTFKNMSNDLIALLRHCDVKLDEGEKVHVIGHDFGSIFMGTLLGYYPRIALTASFLAVPYAPPGEKVNMDAMKQITERVLGFEFFGYRRFLMKDDSWKLMDGHKESFFTLMYGPEDRVVAHFFPPGKLEAWLNTDRRAPLQDWTTREYKDTRDRIFAKEDAYRGPTDWYRARFRDFLGIDEELRDIGSKPRIPCPALFVQSRPSNIFMEGLRESTRKFADVYEYKEVESGRGHFVQLEAPDEVNQALEAFLVQHSSFSNKHSL